MHHVLIQRTVAAWCSCFCLGLLGSCAAARVDSFNKPCCEGCGKRLAKCAGKLYVHKPGHICTPCYKLRKRRPLEPVVNQPAADSSLTPKKQKVERTPSFTPEQAAALRSTLQTGGIGRQGKQRTPEQIASSLLVVAALRAQGRTHSDAVAVAAQAALASRSTLFAAARRLFEHNTIGASKDKRLALTRTPSDNLLKLFCYDGPQYASCTPAITKLLHSELQKCADQNLYCTSTTLLLTVEEQLEVRVSQSTMLRWLHSLGYVWMERHFVNQPRPFRNTLIRKHIYSYAEALRQQGDGTAVLVYTDESYVHSHHSVKKLWCRPDSLTANDVQGDGRGVRLIIIHAMTQWGMLHVDGVEPSNILTELYSTAELIFDEVCADGVSPADYHNTINGEKWVAWMHTRLFPAFNVLFPGKKMILVLDNAKYHHHRGADWFTPYRHKKGALADWLRQRDVKSFVAEGRTFYAADYSANAQGKNSKGPTLKALQHAVKAVLAANPDINTTVPAQLMRDKGHELLYSPPYISELQPIELIWGYTKHLVARANHKGRKPHEAATHTREAMHFIGAELCARFIHKTHRWMELFMRGEEGGSLKQYSSLTELIRLGQGKADDAVIPVDQLPLLQQAQGEEEE